MQGGTSEQRERRPTMCARCHRWAGVGRSWAHMADLRQVILQWAGVAMYQGNAT